MANLKKKEKRGRSRKKKKLPNYMWNFEEPKQKSFQSASKVFSYLAQCGVIKQKETSSDNQQSRAANTEKDDLDTQPLEDTCVSGMDVNKDPDINSTRILKQDNLPLEDERNDYVEKSSELIYGYDDVYEKSDSSYVPNSCTSDTSSVTEDELEPIKKPVKLVTLDKGFESDVSSVIPLTGESCNSSQVTGSSSLSNKSKDNVKVLKHNNTVKKRKWDKKHCCFYCSKFYAKISRHFEQKHKDEIAVAQALSHKKGTKERKAKLKLLLHRGDFKYNKIVATSTEGSLIPAKRQITDGSIHDYTTCERCFGLFLRKNLWRHKKKCATKEIEKDESKKTQGYSKNRNLLFTSVGTFDDDDNNFKENILNSMNCDTVSLLCRQDQLILQFGRNMFAKHLDQQHQFQYIKYRMREIARFVLEMRKQSEVEYLSDCICPLQFKTIIKTVKKCAKFDSNTGMYQTPSVALKLGHSLRACAAIMKSNALQMGDLKLEKQADAFITLCNSDWSHSISSRALHTLHRKKFNSTRRIPLANDVKRLYVFLQTIADAARETLKSSPNPSSWKNLAEVSLAQIVLFNRRRGGEMQRMQLDDYQKGLVSGKSLQGEIMQSLSNFERTLAKELDRVEIRGKRGRRVPVLLTQYYKENIELLLDYRESNGLCSDNTFIFGRKGSSNTTLRTSDILRKYSNECGAVQPQLLTSTALRKHIGTIYQLLNLKENELEALATFMGHDKAVHKQYYRLPEDTIQLAKVSKILLQLEKGNIKSCKDKSLDDIELPDADIIGDDELSTGNDDADEDADDENTSMEMTQGQMHMFDKPAFQSKTAIESSNKSLKALKAQRKEWSQSEKDAVEQEFGSYFYMMKRLPGKSNILSAMRKQPVLAKRPWTQIKYYIKNIQIKNNKF